MPLATIVVTITRGVAATIAQNKMIVRMRMVARRGTAHGTSATARIIPWYSSVANAIAAAATHRPRCTFSGGREARYTRPASAIVAGIITSTMSLEKRSIGTVMPAISSAAAREGAATDLANSQFLISSM